MPQLKCQSLLGTFLQLYKIWTGGVFAKLLFFSTLWPQWPSPMPSCRPWPNRCVAPGRLGRPRRRSPAPPPSALPDSPPFFSSPSSPLAAGRLPLSPSAGATSRESASTASFASSSSSSPPQESNREARRRRVHRRLRPPLSPHAGVDFRRIRPPLTAPVTPPSSR